MWPSLCILPRMEKEGVVSDSGHNVNENFLNVLNPWYPANKGAGSPQILQQELLRWHLPWFLNGTIIYKRKSDDIYFINLKRTRTGFFQQLTHCCHLKPADASIIYTSGLAAPITGRLTFSTFTNKIQATILEPQIQAGSDPRPDHQLLTVQFSSIAQSCPTLRPHESQHARPPCPSPTPRFHSDPGPSSRWCHPAISSSVVPFSSCPQSK